MNMSLKKETLAGLEINLRTGLYQIRENKFTYDFEFDMLANLKNYLRFQKSNNRGSIAAWYKSLKGTERRRVIINAGFEN
jgi:hypothetical protein